MPRTLKVLALIGIVLLAWKVLSTDSAVEVEYES